MPVTLPTALPTVITAAEIRRFMRDYPGPGNVPDTGVINILLDGVEFSDADIAQGIDYTGNEFNFIVPILGLVSVTSIPKIFLLYGVASYLLNSEAMRQLRNQATVQDGDVQGIGIDDKHTLYLNAAKMLWDRFIDLATKYKVTINLRQAWGNFGSGYRNIGRRTG